jgi:hypothetical protein
MFSPHLAFLAQEIAGQGICWRAHTQTEDQERALQSHSFSQLVTCPTG